MTGYRCATCGKYHDSPPLHYTVALPDYIAAVPEQDRKKRCAISTDQCVLDEKFFFILGNLEIPVIGTDDLFSWDVWVSLSEDNFVRMSQLWNKLGRESEPPYFGWLSTNISIYPSTINLRTMVHTRAIGHRPFVELELTDHPLAVEQRTGMDWTRIQQIAEHILHRDTSAYSV